MDLQSGRIMAVKVIPVKEGKEKDLKESAKKEVEILANNSYVSRSFSGSLGYLLTVKNRTTIRAIFYVSIVMFVII